MSIRQLCTAVFLYFLISPQVQAASLKGSIGSGIQYGGILGLQGSINFNGNKLKTALGYAGFTLGYDRFLTSNTSLGIQAFNNQYITGYALSLNYYLNPHTRSGWLVGLDLYRAADTNEIALDFYTDLVFNPDDIDIDADVDNGIFISVGYQF